MKIDSGRITGNSDVTRLGKGCRPARNTPISQICGAGDEPQCIPYLVLSNLRVIVLKFMVTRCACRRRSIPRLP